MNKKFRYEYNDESFIINVIGLFWNGRFCDYKDIYAENGEYAYSISLMYVTEFHDMWEEVDCYINDTFAEELKNG